ncbi:MAG TPA: DUF1501 domain-containing protein [Tepidisphaeraceae bacterium]|nr:DUF1501 domain-containing protein [Tepidisphaeraceae bacterium]
MQTTRREMLKVGLGGLSVVSLASTMPAFLAQFARADAPATSPVSDDNILVVVQLSGGNDGLNTIIPVENDIYLKARPGIGIKQKYHKLNDDFALNPGMGAFKELFDQGRLAIVNGCGYPNPNRSHFESMSIWHAADPVNGQQGGWLGHYLEHLQRGTGPLQAVNIGTELPQALVNDVAPVPSIQSMDEYRLRTESSSSADSATIGRMIRELNAAEKSSPALQFLSRTATNAIISSDQIRRVTGAYKPDVNYPENLGNRLKLIAQIIAGNFGTKLFYCDVSGFDTHANQLGTHEQVLSNVASSIRAFLADLDAKKLADKVVVMCFSEFGRRVAQNDSGGTDHGAAGPMFVVGNKVNGGLFGQYPSLDKLESGDLKYTTDFRRVYATLLDGWLNVDSPAVLQNRFEPIAMLDNLPASISPAAHPSQIQTSEPEQKDPEDGGMMMKMNGL